MPELPEVETVRRQLKPLILGLTIEDITMPYASIVRMDAEYFKEKLIGKRFTDLNRYGKYLLFELGDLILVSHLRMEGKYYLYEDLAQATKHDHIMFHLDNGLFLSYHDVRKFGTMELTNKKELFKLPSLKKLGPEVNDAHIDIDRLYRIIHRSKRPIKSLLLDQSLMAGLGNIYVDETLFMAKIHPQTKGIYIKKKQVADLIDASYKVVHKAIALGGTTIRTYHSTMGVDGRFQNELNVHTKKDQPCPRCQTKIIKIKVGGRGTYVCPSCQKRRSS